MLDAASGEAFSARGTFVPGVKSAAQAAVGANTGLSDTISAC
jgi:hypothetical protein